MQLMLEIVISLLLFAISSLAQQQLLEHCMLRWRQVQIAHQHLWQQRAEHTTLAEAAEPPPENNEEEEDEEDPTPPPEIEAII
jgi:hypothetical protein